MRPPLGEELLPPVEQPSAKFIIQLFVVPALIVMGIVGLWLSFNWLVRSATIDPKRLIAGIESGPSVARWQRANELADMLNNRRNVDMKRDPKLASQLGGILDREIEQSKDGHDSQEQATLRHFLVLALGEFEVPDGTNVLLKAATANRTENDELVRKSAIEALAVRAYNLKKLDPPQQLSDPDLEPTLIALAADENSGIRSRATYALGKLATANAIKKLEVLVDDPDADTRYNAAIALAHLGNAKATETLAEMLDLSELAKGAEADAKSNEDPGFKRAVIISSAIDAAHALARQNPEADLSSVNKALEALVQADGKSLKAAHVPARIVSDAKRALDVMKSQP
jgi:HEAT repeat protein